MAMDPVKRRLVYVADEHEALLRDLSGTPPTRPTRQTRLLIPPSPVPSSQRSSGPLSPQPRPATAVHRTPATVAVDTRLLVSFDGHLLADGGGGFAAPRNAAEAAALRDALAVCRLFLRQFVRRDGDEEASASRSTTASSSTYVEEGEEGSDSSDSFRVSPPQRRRRPRAAVPSALSPSKMTVLELKAWLRGHGASAAGNKASLLLRAEALRGAKPAAATEEVVPPTDDDVTADTHITTPQRSPSAVTAGSMVSVRLSRGTPSSAPASPASSFLVSPVSRISTGSNGLWGALVTASTRLFGRTARHSFGSLRHPAGAVGEEEGGLPPAKRRRSA